MSDLSKARETGIGKVKNLTASDIQSSDVDFSKNSPDKLQAVGSSSSVSSGSPNLHIDVTELSSGSDGENSLGRGKIDQYSVMKEPSNDLKNINSSSKRRNKTHKRGVYWRNKAQPVSITPCGGSQLLITPWMWRRLPMSAYHLTSKAEKATALFELGLVDAAEHHMELLKFFNPEEYLSKLNNHDNV